MHNSPKDLKSRILRAISYILIAVFVGLGTYYLANYAQGIMINPATGDTTQNGLVMIQSKPVSANVMINDQPLKEDTPTRQILPIGNYTASLVAEGYRPWIKDFTVIGSDIIWLDYPLLIPKEITTTQETVLGKKPIVASSNNRRLVMIGDGDELRLFNVSGKQTTESEVKLSKALRASLGKNPRLEKLVFASNDRYLLARYSSDKQRYFVRIDREQPNQSVNLNDLFNLELKEVIFDEDGNFNNFYGQAKGNLYQFNIDDADIKELEQDVYAFHSFKDYIFIVVSNPNNKNQALLSYRKGNNDFVEIGKIAKSDQYLLDAQQFKDRINVVVASSKKTYIYKNIQRKVKSTVVIKLPAKQAEFSSNGRFLAVSDGMNVQMFDLEFGKKFKFSISDKSVNFRWIDNFRLSFVAGKQAWLIDFDGNNNQPIVKASPLFIPITSQNNESLLTIRKDTDKYVLERSRLRVE